MSLGINLLVELSKTASKILGDKFDVEIIEKHHNQKIDAPSGTAIMLANGINEVNDGKYTYEYNRQAKREKRGRGGFTFSGKYSIIKIRLIWKG